MTSPLTHLRAGIAPALALALTLWPAPASTADTPSYHVVRGEIRVICPLTVGGLFETKTTAISGTVRPETAPPGALGGEIRVDLSSLDTGIELRNTHLREKYLEVASGAEFATAVLSAVRFDKADGPKFRGRTPFTGTLLLHGTRRPVAGQADIRPEGNSVRVVASFPVRLDDYGIAAPRYLGVGVKNEVQVKVSLVVAPEAAPAAEGTR